MRNDVFFHLFLSQFDDGFIGTFVHSVRIDEGDVPESQIPGHVPFDGRFYRFVCLFHGLKGVEGILFDDAHNCP